TRMAALSAARALGFFLIARSGPPQRFRPRSLPARARPAYDPPVRFRVVLLVLGCLVGAARAGTLIGKVDLPPVARPDQVTRGFLDRAENPLAPVKPYSVAPQLVVELVGDE